MVTATATDPTKLTQLTFETIKPHVRTHVRTIPVAGYTRMRRVPVKASFEDKTARSEDKTPVQSGVLRKKEPATETSQPSTSPTEQAVAIAQTLDPRNIGPLLGAFQRAHKAGYVGRHAQRAASQIYWGMRDGPMPDQMGGLKGFVAATSEIEQLMRPADLPYPQFDEDMYRTELRKLGKDGMLKKLRAAGYIGKYLHPLVLEDALVRIWRKQRMHE